MLLNTRSDSKLFNPASHSRAGIQRLISCLAYACQEFGLTISLTGQDVSGVPSICIGHYTLEVVEEFTYLGPTISSNLSLDTKIRKRIGKAASAVARLSKRVWENTKLTINTKISVYNACVLCSLLFGNETRTA